MKRLIICLTIIAAIIAAGICTIGTVAQKNERLYGKIDSVLASYGESGAEAEIAELKKFFEREYAPGLSLVVNDAGLGEMMNSISKLGPMLESGCDEFLAECEAIRSEAERIYLAELPGLFRVF